MLQLHEYKLNKVTAAVLLTPRCLGNRNGASDAESFYAFTPLPCKLNRLRAADNSPRLIRVQRLWLFCARKHGAQWINGLVSNVALSLFAKTLVIGNIVFVLSRVITRGAKKTISRLDNLRLA